MADEQGFVKISRDEVRPVQSGPPLGPRTKTLLAGETIWCPGGKSWQAGAYSTLKARGFRLHTQLMIRDGVTGYAAWAEKIES